VLLLLEATKRERGRLPLVLAPDNDPGYTSEEVEAYLARERVLHLRNVPYTPEHNARAERSIREVREETGLGKGVRVGRLAAAVGMGEALLRLNDARLRRSLGWRTAKEVDRTLPTGYDEATREKVYEAACEAVRTAVANERNGRARRRKQREAILATLESYGF
jgi:hypothetical protein